MNKKMPPADNAAIAISNNKHCLTHPVAVSMISKYKTFRNEISDAMKDFGGFPFDVPEFPLAIVYNKALVQNLLNVDGCAGLKIYPAVNDQEKLTLILVAINEHGEAISSNGEATKNDNCFNQKCFSVAGNAW